MSPFKTLERFPNQETVVVTVWTFSTVCLSIKDLKVWRHFLSFPAAVCRYVSVCPVSFYVPKEAATEVNGATAKAMLWKTSGSKDWKMILLLRRFHSCYRTLALPRLCFPPSCPSIKSSADSLLTQPSLTDWKTQNDRYWTRGKNWWGLCAKKNTLSERD